MRISSAALMILLLAAPLRAEESLAEASKKQKEAQKKLESSGQQVPSYRVRGEPVAGPASQTPPAAAPAAEPVERPAAAEAPPRHEEERLWREFRAKATALRLEIDRLQKEVADLSTVNGRHIEYEVKKTRLDRLKVELENLEESGRRQNIPPGYLR